MWCGPNSLCNTPPPAHTLFNLTLQAPTSVCAASLQPCEAASEHLFGRAGEIARSITRARSRHVRTGGDTAPVITSDRPPPPLPPLPPPQGNSDVFIGIAFPYMFIISALIALIDPSP